MSINWKKGLVRVWLVFAVIWWIGCVFSFFYKVYKGDFAYSNFDNYLVVWRGLLFPFLFIILFFIGKAALNVNEWIKEGFGSLPLKRRVWWAAAVIWWIFSVCLFFLNRGMPSWNVRHRDSGHEVLAFFTFSLLFPFFIVGLFKLGKIVLKWFKEGFKDDKPPIIEDKEK